MGAIADATLAAGGTAIGVIPTRLVEAEVAHAGLTELHVVDTMHERKALMSELSDAVIALPGGTGTLDEFFELFTWSQLGLHRMPLGLLNVAGYWDPLLAFLDHAVDERFLRAEHLATLIVSREPGALLDELAAYKPRALDKWLDRRPRDQVGAEHAVAGVAQARAGCRRSRRARGRRPRSRSARPDAPSDRLDPLGRRHQADELELPGAGPLEVVQRVHGAAAGGEHRVEHVHARVAAAPAAAARNSRPARAPPRRGRSRGGRRGRPAAAAGSPRPSPARRGAPARPPPRRAAAARSSSRAGSRSRPP